MKKFRIYLTVPYNAKYGCADLSIGYVDVDCGDPNEASDKARENAAGRGWLYTQVQSAELISGGLNDVT